jgi:hypothetical protein
MANYFYVKAGGTATNTTPTATTDPGTKRTGAFSSMAAGDHFATIKLALAGDDTVSPGSGDFIVVSDAHTNTAASGYTISGTDGAEPLTIISVSDTACEDYSAGASENTSGSGADDIYIAGNVFLKGVSIKPADQMFLAEGDTLLAQDCTIAFHNLNRLSISGDGAAVIAENVTFNTNAADQHLMTPGSGIYFRAVNCTFTGGGGILNMPFNGGATSGGATIELIGCDLSNVNQYIWGGVGGSATDNDNLSILVMDCQMHADAVPNELTFKSAGHRCLVTNSAATSEAAEYQYYYNGWGGLAGGMVADETSIYRDGSTAFPSGQRTSLKVTTGSFAYRTQSAVFDMPLRYSELSNTGTITIHLLSSDTLTDADIWATATYPDGTNKHTPNYVESVTEAFNPFRTGTPLTPNTESWTGRVAENRYEISLDTSAFPGSDSYPLIRIYVAKPNATLFIDSEIVLS